MPWFDPTSSDDQIDDWLNPGGGAHIQVSDWPRPNSIRASDGRYRFTTQADFAPSASRWLVVFNLDTGLSPPPAPQLIGNGAFDATVVSSDTLTGTIPAGDANITFQWDAVAFAVLPVSGLAGVQVTFSVTHPTFGSWEAVHEFNNFNGSSEWLPTIDTISIFKPPVSVTSSPGWPYTFSNVAYASMPDCFDFPPSQGPPIDDFANFNGTDSWIELTNLTPAISEPWRYSADLFIRDRVGAWVLCNSGGVDPRTGYNQARQQWRNVVSATVPDVPLNEWFTWRMERDWSVPTGNRFRAFVNDVQVANVTGPNFALAFNALGGNRPLPALNRWADMKMRNLLLQDTSVASPRTVLDMPLIDNSCDLSPFENHGIPHNMTLPACPP